ncbi:hypothetical protein CLV63_118117 [Murinocardiopsis flavida]|uniref:Uncharacterized protein n=1 Tax=Murinocardiopsis flavida TaxID=645275 RepID=A0A2P8D558_9ACTN|nr:hypothetical protein [Murinocardiopsis flavida]PSK92356.1 hypothetical protein CLV63_118117 [Murinocardiopsis flavida]
MSSDSTTVWEQIADRSDGFEEQCLLRAPFRSPPCRLDDLTRLIRSLSEDPDYAMVTRMLDVTVEGNRRASLKPLVLDDPPKPGEGLAEWSARVFDGRPFGLMVNAVERWSETLARAGAEFFAPARSEFGIPQLSFRISLFLGNYGFTPSGVHRDIGRSERVFHYNAGPGRKSFHSWPVDRYRELTGSTRPSHDPEPLLPYGTGHTMEPGDVLLLNVSRFHVGRSDELAATVGLEMSKMPPGEVLKEATSSVLTGLLRERSAPLHDTEFWSEPWDYTDTAWADLPESGLDAWVREAVDSHIARQRSNLGFSTAPVPLNGVGTDDLRPAAVRLARPFPLVLVEHPDHAEIFVRGVRLKVPRDGISELVDELSSGRELEVADVVRRRRNPDLALKLLTTLVRLRGIDLVRPDCAEGAR